VRAARVICRQERNYRERCRDVINSRASGAVAAASFPVTSRMIILTYVRRWRERDQDGIARRDRTRSAVARGWRRMMWLGARTAKTQNNSSAEKMDESKCRGTSETRRTSQDTAGLPRDLVGTTGLEIDSQLVTHKYVSICRLIFILRNLILLRKQNGNIINTYVNRQSVDNS